MHPKKRAVQNIPIFLDKNFIPDLVKTIEAIKMPYKTNVEELQCRDQALAALLTLSGLRVSEALRLKRLQFKVYDDRIILANASTLKHGLLRAKIILPKEGRLEPFTEIFERWLIQVPNEESYVFPSAKGFSSSFNWERPLRRAWAHRIIFLTTGKFPHWFRSVCETIYGRWIFDKDAWKLKEFMGLRSLDSTSPYVKGTWEEDEPNIFR